MNVLAELRARFHTALADLVDDPAPLVEMVKASQDAKFGDYQANCAMPLAKQLGKPPRDVAAEIIERLDVDALCEAPEVAGPGFINLKLRDDWLAARALDALRDEERLGVDKIAEPKTYVIDYSAPNVAKPMHVGHIRSTVIGDALYRTLSFLGHHVISDNHVGDWGTQFGMIIYGYRNFGDLETYQQEPVAELARVYKLVHRIIGFHDDRNNQLPALEQQLASEEREVKSLESMQPTGDPKADKKSEKARKRAVASLANTRNAFTRLRENIAKAEQDTAFAELASRHADIDQAVLLETAKLHEGDEENVRLWNEFMPACMAEIDKVYERLGVTFDHTLGESYYHEQLPDVVADLKQRGLASDSDGAVCVFLDEFDVPMIVQKKDGAFLYATTDLATIRYRMENWHPYAILYVVDHRQSLHFKQLFATAAKWGCEGVELVHVAFGTVMGEDGRPYKTRSGDTVGLEGLLDEAVARALVVVSENDDRKTDDDDNPAPELDEETRRNVAEVVGIGALKYADLSHNRESDYKFSYDKMLATTGNTATYMQYAYARVRSIFRKGDVDIDAVRRATTEIKLDHPAERALAMSLLRFSEALDAVVAEYYPNQLTDYLFDMSSHYSTFYQQCPVLKAEDETTRTNRLLLCDLTARTLKQGLALLGIDVVEQM
ncbi:MAG: arginine--tRNA ligase [Pirellulales bacterium]|nr:arginine--tRNA ligase [Pirellulales bacterium]